MDHTDCDLARFRVVLALYKVIHSRLQIAPQFGLRKPYKKIETHEYRKRVTHYYHIIYTMVMPLQPFDQSYSRLLMIDYLCFHFYG